MPGNATSVRSKPRSVYSKLPTYPFAREEFLASEMRWLKLAENYELSERLTYFLNRPPVFPKHPICPNCHVPMWLLEIQSRSEKVEFFTSVKFAKQKKPLPVRMIATRATRRRVKYRLHTTLASPRCRPPHSHR